MPPFRNRYLLMRHGHSLANEAGLIISDPEQGVGGYGLSEGGHTQLKQLTADWQWPEPDAIVHSDFLRTTETARYVAEQFGLVMTPEKGLRERYFGVYEGKADLHYHEVWALDKAESDSSRQAQTQRELLQINLVETLDSVALRMQSVIERLETQHEGLTLLLVSHGDPLQILLTSLEQQPLGQHRQREPLLPAGIIDLGNLGSQGRN